jgi:hypothetical protein
VDQLDLVPQWVLYFQFDEVVLRHLEDPRCLWLLGFPQFQEFQGVLAKVILVLLEMLALLDSPDPVVSKATMVRGVQQVSTVRRAKEATRASREIWVKKVIVVSLVPWVKQENLGHKELKVAKDPGVKLELLDLKGTKAKLGRQAFQDILEDLETRVIKASKEAMGFLVPKVNEAGMVQ